MNIFFAIIYDKEEEIQVEFFKPKLCGIITHLRLLRKIPFRVKFALLSLRAAFCKRIGNLQKAALKSKSSNFPAK
ncbi:MAG: hypothetical protein AAF443_07385, partial [Chlamydiota bacterium]